MNKTNRQTHRMHRHTCNWLSSLNNKKKSRRFQLCLKKNDVIITNNKYFFKLIYNKLLPRNPNTVE